MKGLIFFSIVLILSLIMSTNLSGCGGESFQTDKAIADSLAEISGQVMISKTIKSNALVIFSTNTSDEKRPFIWIVNVTFTNRGYENPIINVANEWNIVVGERIYNTDNNIQPDISPLITVPINQTGNVVLCFLIYDDINVSDALLRFTKGTDVSYGRLSGDEIIPGYDWESKSVIEEIIVEEP